MASQYEDAMTMKLLMYVSVSFGMGNAFQLRVTWAQKGVNTTALDACVRFRMRKANGLFVTSVVQY